ncbi:hypothetical protein [Demequina gelatinilytica]|uniref:hypothetical protein n=1 Tax=Demequina gelatinilytica TaxID=1638980 RepID=UPI0007856983|nr:hypothetical protein [Demequina gelatinilytica]
MPNDAALPLVAIPEGATLLHIGAPKTGTSALQFAASQRREELAAKGVIYPRPDAEAVFQLKHKHAVRSLMAYGRGEVAEPTAWLALLEQREADPRARTLVTEELGLLLNRKAIDFARESLGSSASVVLTTRNLEAFIVSLWQQNVRNGRITADVGTWLSAFLGPDATERVPKAWRHAGALRPWVEAFGAENVTAVVVDKADPDRVFRSFAALLGLDVEDLRPAGEAQDQGRANRGFTAVETEFALRLGALAREEGLSSDEYFRLLHRGAYFRIQSRRTPGPDEARVGVPAAMQGFVRELAEQQWSVLERLGVTVIGEKDELVRSGAPAPESPVKDGMIPIDLAFAAVMGVLEQASPELAQRLDLPLD